MSSGFKGAVSNQEGKQKLRSQWEAGASALLGSAMLCWQGLGSPWQEQDSFVLKVTLFPLYPFSYQATELLTLLCHLQPQDTPHSLVGYSASVLFRPLLNSAWLTPVSQLVSSSNPDRYFIAAITYLWAGILLHLAAIRMNKLLTYSHKGSHQKDLYITGPTRMGFMTVVSLVLDANHLKAAQGLTLPIRTACGGDIWPVYKIYFLYREGGGCACSSCAEN